MDITLEHKVIQARKTRQVFKWLTGAVFLLGSFFILRFTISPEIDARKIRTAIVEQGSVSAEITASGVVVPLRTQISISPTNSSIQEIYKSIGSSVKTDDAILRLNNREIQLEITRLQDEIKLKELEIEGLLQNQQKNIREFENQKALLELDLKQKKTVLENYQTLYQSKTISKLDLDRAQLDVDKTQLQVLQLERQVADNKISDENQLNQYKLQKKLLEQKLQKTLDLNDDMTIRANMSGVITSMVDRLGDNVTAGQELVEISDLSSYRIDATLSDFHSQSIREGLPATIAFGDTTVKGQISRILPAFNVGTMNLEITLANPGSEFLQQNLRADVKIKTRFKNLGMRVPNGPAFNGSGRQDIFMVKGTMAVRKTVEVGLVNSDSVQILSGLSEGDKIIISDMSDYLHLEQIEIED